MTVANSTPESAARSFETSLRYLAPGALSMARATMVADLARIRRDRISAACTIIGELHSTTHDDRMIVTVPGHKRIYAGRELMSEKPVTYHLTVALVPATRTYPQGMQLIEVQQGDPAARNAKGATDDVDTTHEARLASPRG